MKIDYSKYSTDDIHSFTGSVNIIGNVSMSTGGITASKDIVLDNYNYTPTPTEGGFLLSGSDFYIGLG